MNCWHMDDEVNAKYVALNDALCSWERATSRRSTLLLIPASKDEAILVSHDGKPVDQRGGDAVFVLERVSLALNEREDSRA